MKGDRTIAESKDRRYRVVQNELAAQVSWMTRHDLYEWVWAQPIGQINAMLGLTMIGGWHCSVYEIVRPTSGYFASLRAGNRPERVPLTSERDPDEPVPLADFIIEPNGKHTLRVGPSFLLSNQLGPPTLESQVYPRTENCALLSAPLVGVSKKLLRLSAGQVTGPPEAMSLSLLHQIAFKLSKEETSRLLGLYGLTDREVAMLYLRHEIAAIGHDRVNAGSYESGRFGCLPKRKLTVYEKAQTVDLSPATRLAVAEECEIERIALEYRQCEMLKRKNETSAKLRDRINFACSRLTAILERANEGYDLFSAARAEGIPNSVFVTAIVKVLKNIKKPELTDWKRTILRSIKAKASLSERDIIMLSDCISTAQDNYGAGELELRNYGDRNYGTKLR